MGPAQKDFTLHNYAVSDKFLYTRTIVADKAIRKRRFKEMTIQGTCLPFYLLFIYSCLMMTFRYIKVKYYFYSKELVLTRGVCII